MPSLARKNPEDARIEQAGWIRAAFLAAAANLALFLLMPNLLASKTTALPDYESLVPRVSIVRLKEPPPAVIRPEKPEPPPEKKSRPKPDPVVKNLVAPKKPVTAETSKVVPPREPAPAAAPPPPPAPAFENAPPATEAPATAVSVGASGGVPGGVPGGVVGGTVGGTVGGVPGGKSVAGTGGPVEEGLLDKPLKVLAREAPLYPKGARSRGVEGWVRVSMIVDKIGRVEKVEIVKAEPPETFERSVRRCVEKWRFTPGTVGGTPVRVRVETTVRFKLE